MLDHAFWANDWPSCQLALQEIKDAFGDSFWIIGAEIALRQHFLGLDAQKAFTAKVTETYKGGLPAYVAYHLSVRNERGSTNLLFDEDFREQMQRSKIARDSKAFLTYKMTGEHDLTDRGISTAIQLEQGSSIVDYYETIIDLLQRAVCADNTPTWNDAALEFLKSCDAIADYRAEKLRAAYGEITPNQRSVRQAEAGDRRIDALGEDFWSAIWPMVRAARGSTVIADEETPAGLIKRYLGSLIARDATFDDCRLALNKFSRNFGFVRSARAAGDFADFITLRARNSIANLAKPTLNSPCQDLLSLLPARDLISNSRQLFSTSEGLPQELQKYRSALIDARKQPENARDLIDAMDLDVVSEGQANLVRNLLLQIELDEGESDAALQLIGV